MRQQSAIEMQRFEESLEDLGLKDVGFKGNEFTFYIVRKEQAKVWEKLDMFVANKGWRMRFPHLKVYLGNTFHLDHILIDNSSWRQQGRRKRRGQIPF